MSFDRDFDRITKMVVAIWIVAIAASVALTGVGIWAIIMLVKYFTGG